MGPKILSGVGCLLFGLSFAALAVSLILPLATNGRASWDEAMMGIIPGGICSCLSLLPLGGGIVWWVLAGRKKPA